MFCTIYRKKWIFCWNEQKSERIFKSINRSNKASKLFEISFKNPKPHKSVKMFFKILNGKKVLGHYLCVIQKFPSFSIFRKNIEKNKVEILKKNLYQINIFWRVSFIFGKSKKLIKVFYVKNFWKKFQWNALLWKSSNVRRKNYKQKICVIFYFYFTFYQNKRHSITYWIT